MWDIKYFGILGRQKCRFVNKNVIKILYQLYEFKEVANIKQTCPNTFYILRTSYAKLNKASAV
jgi:hypothetical protein